MDSDIYLKNLAIKLRENRGTRYSQLCLNYAQKLITNKVPVIFDIKHFSLLLGINLRDLCTFIFADDDIFYSTLKIPKKSSGYRELAIPCMNLKHIQRWILNNILVKIPISDFAMGFHKARSIVHNAKHHLNQKCLINIDLKDFFPSIKTDDLFRLFYYYGYTKELSFFFSRICSYKGSLPQGAPTSPYLSNIICLKLDLRLSLLAKKYNANYSRYADDITISGNRTVANIIGPLINIIEDQGFLINDKKTRVQHSHQRQEVTGLIVNGNTLKVPKEYKMKLKQEIYFCQKFGVSNHLNKVSDSYNFYKEHLYGKAYFIHMVEPELAKKFLTQLDKINWDY